MTNTASRWEMRSFRKKCISIDTDSKSTECSASLILKTSSHTTPNIPIGINEWTFPADGYERTPRMLNFHKYVDQPGNYCCNDGTCFTSELVCDGISHCQSGEDEVNCTMINIPEYYDKMDPPEEAVANITIMDIMDVDEDDSSYVVYFRLSVKWYDRKLDFHYLKNKDYANIIPEEYTKQIWIPELDFSFVQHSYDLQQIKHIYVQKTKIKRVKSDLIFPSETYDGASNPLIYVSEHRIKFFL